MTIPTQLLNLCSHLSTMNISAHFVGGCVRDELLGVSTNDIDITLVGVENVEATYRAIQEHSTKVSGEVGASFPVWIAEFNGLKVDIALARKENSTGVGHKDFTCSTEKVSLVEDLARRDLTINAIAKNVLTGELTDPFNGQGDLTLGLARPCTEAFMEDPLRVYRAARFISRFNLTPSSSLLEMCRKVDVSTLPKERVGKELEKMFEQAARPSLFFRFLFSLSITHIHFKELADVIGVNQDPTWHPEGDVYNHTMHCMDQTTSPLIRCTMLCHDLGKATTTVFSEGRWKAPGHAAAGVEPTLNMLRNLSFKNRKFQEKVACLVKNHMVHTNEVFTRRAVMRLVRKLNKHDITFDHLVEVCRCDVSGRPPLKAYTPNIGQELAVLEEATTPIVTGKMLIAKGITPGPKMGEMLRHFQAAQDDGTITEENWEHLFLAICS